MVTRAVHLETCPDLNTDTLLNAFRRFSSRPYQPQLLYSDNGKTFVGASEELKTTVKALDNDRFYKALAVANTTWKFNPPYGPHFGAECERLIQSGKRTLLLILGSRRLSFDTFLTLMVETESVLKSRPLTNVAEQPDNEEPLATRTIWRPATCKLENIEEHAEADEPYMATLGERVSANP
ncbi:uncharacterized protein LOC142340375 [Convolutriloba macropyga]|uniref:uncharacterized protein LOC142340375 n=1 Tax=Convolutriloba macropyga TaxID=536237 RepID=UPI003F525614